MARVRTSRCRADELARAEGYLLGRYAMDRRTERADRLVPWRSTKSKGWAASIPTGIRARVEAVTAADIQRVARTYLADPSDSHSRPALSCGRDGLRRGEKVTRPRAEPRARPLQLSSVLRRWRARASSARAGSLSAASPTWSGQGGLFSSTY